MAPIFLKMDNRTKALSKMENKDGAATGIQTETFMRANGKTILRKERAQCGIRTWTNMKVSG